MRCGFPAPVQETRLLLPVCDRCDATVRIDAFCPGSAVKQKPSEPSGSARFPVNPAPYLSKNVGSAQYMISSTLLVLWPPLHWV